MTTDRTGLGVQSADFGLAAGDYVQHRAGFPPAFFERLAAYGVGLPGQRVLDLGSGTGTVARGMARRGCRTIALDPSAAMLAGARGLADGEGTTLDLLRATAERTGLRDGVLDVVTAGQCWHWFDRAAAAAEARRVLVPGGTLVIAHFDWLPLPGNVAEATETLINAHNPAWRNRNPYGIYPPWTRDVAVAGFRDLETFSFDEQTSYSHAAWRGRVRASAGIGPSLDAEGIRRFDQELAATLHERFPDDPLTVPHRIWALICRAP